MIYIEGGPVLGRIKVVTRSHGLLHGAVASEEAAIVTLRRRCSADLPTRQAVQMAREALRRGFVLPQTVCHPAIDRPSRWLTC